MIRHEAVRDYRKRLFARGSLKLLADERDVPGVGEVTSPIMCAESQEIARWPRVVEPAKMLGITEHAPK